MYNRRIFFLLLLLVTFIVSLSSCGEIYYSLVISIEGMGTVSPMSGRYLSGTVVQLTVTPEPGWKFYQWSGDSYGIVDNKVTMDEDKHIVAEFRGDLGFSASQRIGKKPCTITFTTSTNYPDPEKLTFEWNPNVYLLAESPIFTGSAIETYTYDEWSYIYASCRATGPDNYTAAGGAYIWLDPMYDSSSTFGVAPLSVLFFPKNQPKLNFNFNSYNYSWSFGDEYTKDNGSSQENYIFNNPGIYTITVTISDETGASESTERNICAFNGTLRTSSPAGIHVLNHYAYLAIGDNGLQIVDISNLASPRVIKTINTPGNAKTVYVSSNYAYVADGPNGLQIIDISDPYNAMIIGSLDTPGDACGIYVSNQYAYIADGNSGLQIINVANAASPSHVSTINIVGTATDVYVIDNYAYVASGIAGVQIINISDPTTPFIAGSMKSVNVVSVFVKNHYCYITGSNSLNVVDINNPSNPISVAILQINQAKNAYIYGNYAYVISDDDFLYLIDISSPTNPIIKASVKMPQGLNDIFVYSNQVYIADGQYGLVITRVFE